MDRMLFPDGLDVFVDDLTTMQTVVESELLKRTEHVTAGKGVAEGLTITTAADQVIVAAGQAYDNTRYRLVHTPGPATIAVAGGDVGSYVVIERTTTNTLSDTHPVTGVAVFRRTVEGVNIHIVASPTSAQVKLCKITAASTGVAPTISTTGTDRELLVPKVGRPYKVVANDGSGDYTNLAAAVAALSGTGGKIFIKTGVYDLGAAVTINYSNLTIEGAGPSTRLRVSDSATGVLNFLGAGIGSEISNLVVSNLTLEYTDQFVPTGAPTTCVPLLKANYTIGLTVDSVWFMSFVPVANYKLYGATVLNSKHCKFMRNHFMAPNATQVNAGGFNLGFYHMIQFDSTQFAIVGNSFSGAQGSAITVSASSGGGKGTIADNEMQNCANYQGFGVISILDGGYVSITGNQMTGGGIGVLSNAAGLSIASNAITGMTSYGIYLQSSSSKNLVRGNILIGNANSGVRDTGTANTVGVNIT